MNLTDTLKKYFGFDTFKGEQEQIIRNLLGGNDTFVLLPTGGGKSLCYQLPSLVMEGVAIVISPLIALMKNQVDAMRHYGEEDGVAHFLNSSLNKSAIDQVKSDILAGKTKLLYVAPESLTKEENVEFLKNCVDNCEKELQAEKKMADDTELIYKQKKEELDKVQEHIRTLEQKIVEKGERVRQLLEKEQNMCGTVEELKGRQNRLDADVVLYQNEIDRLREHLANSDLEKLKTEKEKNKRLEVKKDA